MKRFSLPLLLALLAPLTLGGCFVHTRNQGHGHGKAAKNSPGCHPSQYWDGEHCRHKGKGKGARKHDD